MLKHGALIYQARCASCHGVHLEGQANWRERGADGRMPAPPHDSSGHTWHHPDDVLIRITKEGVAKAVGLPDYATNMPAFGDNCLGMAATAYGCVQIPLPFFNI